MDPSKQSLLGASAAVATYDPSALPALPEENPSPSAPPDEKPAPPQIEFDNLPAYAQSAIRISTPQSAHVRGTVFSVVVLGAIGVLGAIAAGALDLPVEAGYGILAGAYVVYFIEALCSDTFAYVRNLQSGVSAEGFLNSLRNTAPRVTMSCVCYHYETRVEYVSESDGRGGTRRRAVTKRVRVNTYSETAEFRYLSWRDTSGPASGLTAYRITKLRLERYVIWADPATRDRFYWEYQQFQERNRFRDRHMDVSWGMNVDGFEPKILAVTEIELRPWFLNTCGYLLATLVLLSVPFRVWLSRNSVQGDFALLKEVRSEPVPTAVVVVLPAYFVRA